MPTDDEMDEDPGHYDIIPKKRPAPEKKAKSARQSKKGAANTYETVVGDPDSESFKIDPTYSAVTDDVNDPVYSGINEDQSDVSDRYAKEAKGNHPYAVVQGVGDAQYAHIDEVAKQNRRSQLQQSHAAESMETLDGSYASVPPPPVPDKNFDAASDTGELSSHPGAVLSSSPSLPPRNSVAAANGNGLDLSHGSDGGITLPPSMVMASAGVSNVGVNGASMVPLDGADDGAAGASAAGMYFQHVIKGID